MRNKGIALTGMTLLIGGLLATGAAAQTQMASAVPAPPRDVLVFADKGSRLSPTAQQTVRNVAAEARDLRLTLIGRPANVAAVRAELERQGVPASAMWDPLESTCRHASLSIL